MAQDQIIRGVLFDLDGTLLDINIDEFLERYFAALIRYMAQEVAPGVELALLRQSLHEATRAMLAPHEGTNREAFNRRMLQVSGIDLDLPDAAQRVHEFYVDIFPSLREGAGPNAGSSQAVSAVLEAGLPVAVATHPLFPAAAIEERLRWAGLEPSHFDAITTYEVMEAAKPAGRYFIQTAQLIGLAPHECIMVGDDAELDLPARHVGMRTFHVADTPGSGADHHGTLRDFVSLLQSSR